MPHLSITDERGQYYHIASNNPETCSAWLWEMFLRCGVEATGQGTYIQIRVQPFWPPGRDTADWPAYSNREFFRQINFEPANLIEAGRKLNRAWSEYLDQIEENPEVPYYPQ